MARNKRKRARFVPSPKKSNQITNCVPQKEGDNHAKPRRRFSIKGKHMESVSVVIGTIGAIVLVYATVFADVHRDTALWMNFAGAVLLLLAPFIYVQDKLWEHDADSVEKEALADYLVPVNDPENANKDLALHFDVGNSRAIAHTFPTSIIRQGLADGTKEDILILGKEKGRLWVSAKFFNKNGNIICELVKNRIHLNHDELFRIEKTPSRLTVFDKRAKVALDIEFTTSVSARLLGEFWIREGLKVSIGPERQTFGLTSFSENVKMAA